jgi:hypothetical protein
MQDAERFERKLLETCTVYGRQLETQLFDAWWRACANLSDDTFERAVDEAVKECTHFPTPAQVRAISYRLREERAQRVGEESGIPGVPLLEAGEAVTIAKREGAKYALHPVGEPLFSCLVCRDHRFVRVDTMAGMPHFARAIPCPHCQASGYDAYVGQYGVPSGLPKWAGA